MNTDSKTMQMFVDTINQLTKMQAEFNDAFESANKFSAAIKALGDAQSEHLFNTVYLMKNIKVTNVWADRILFDNGIALSSDHQQDCCENHYLYFGDLTIADFEGLSFDISGDGFFNRIPEYGVELVPILGHSVKIPGYGSNNGYYSDNLNLVLSGKGFKKEFDVSECQVVTE